MIFIGVNNTMEDIEEDTKTLNALFKKNALLPVEKHEYDDKKYNVILTEPESDYSVKIREVPQDLCVIKVDLFKAPSDIFQGNQHENKRADYMLISPESRCIIYIELKRNECEPKEIVAQLKGAFCFCKYVQAIGKEFCKNAKFLDNYKHRFVLLWKMNTSIATQPTSTKSTSTHDTPETALRITGADKKSPHFKQLAN
jgi:hypothetical protein